MNNIKLNRENILNTLYQNYEISRANLNYVISTTYLNTEYKRNIPVYVLDDALGEDKKSLIIEKYLQGIVDFIVEKDKLGKK